MPADGRAGGLHRRRSGARSASASPAAPTTSSTCSASATSSNSRTKLRQPPANVDPAMYRCAHTVPAPSRSRAGVTATPTTTRSPTMIGKKPKILPFSLETTSAATLEEMMNAKTLTSKQLVQGGALPHRPDQRRRPGDPGDPRHQPGRAQGSRSKRPAARRRSPNRRWARWRASRWCVDDSINVVGLPTSAGSIALQDTIPGRRCDGRRQAEGGWRDHPRRHEHDRARRGVRRLEHATGLLLARRPGAAASDTNKNVGGSSGGSADAVSTGYRAARHRHGDLDRSGPADRPGRQCRRASA